MVNPFLKILQHQRLINFLEVCLSFNLHKNNIKFLVNLFYIVYIEYSEKLT
jgi:hypothetical protein